MDDPTITDLLLNKAITDVVLDGYNFTLTLADGSVFHITSRYEGGIEVELMREE